MKQVIETIESGSTRDLDMLVNKKLADGFVLVGDLQIVPSAYTERPHGYEALSFKFYRTVAKIKE